MTGRLSSSLRSRQEKRAFASHLPIHIGSRSRFARDPQALPALLPSNRLAFSQRCSGAFSTTTKPSNRLASSQRCSGASSTTHLNCLSVSSWEPLGCLQAPTTDCLVATAVRFGCLPDTKHQDGAQEPRADGHQQRRSQRSLC